MFKPNEIIDNYKDHYDNNGIARKGRFSMKYYENTVPKENWSSKFILRYEVYRTWQSGEGKPFMYHSWAMKLETVDHKVYVDSYATLRDLKHWEIEVYNLKP